MTDTTLNIFIASASEGLDVAKVVRDALRTNIGFQPRIGNVACFKLSMTFIELVAGTRSKRFCGPYAYTRRSV